MLAICMALSIPVLVLIVEQVPGFHLMIYGNGCNPRFWEVQVEDSSKLIGVQFSLHIFIFNWGAMVTIFVISGDG